MLSFFDGLLLGIFLAILVQLWLKNRSSQIFTQMKPDPQILEQNIAVESGLVRTDEDNLKSLRNWQQLFLRVICKNCNWESVVIILQYLSINMDKSPSMLTVARRKSLCIQDIVSFSLQYKIGTDIYEDSSDNEEEGDDHWRERLNLTSEGYPAESRSTYFPLQMLKSDQSRRFDVLLCLPSIDETFSASDTPTRRPSALEDLDSTFLRLHKVGQEFIETERLFVRDIRKLGLLLTELQYSTLPSVREFVQTIPFVGISSSLTVLQTIHSHFLERIESSSLVDDQVIHLSNLESSCRTIFSAVILYAPFFPLLAQYVVHHDSFSSHYNRYMSNFEEFNYFLSNCERLMGETMASLIIKPVQRLPRYVLLCTEMKKLLLKASEKATHYDPTVEEETHYPVNMNEILATLSDSCVNVCQIISSAAHSCNEIVRAHQDNIRMHELHNSLLSGGSSLSPTLPVVVKERKFIKEGDLFRHHKNSSMRLHRIQLFSDVLLSSAPSGTSLYLEQQISLTTNSGTFCIPIPSPTLQRDLTLGNCTHWFLVGAENKNLYFGCNSESDMMKWVDAIQNCLSSNKAETDYGKFREQLGLINTLLNEIDTKRQILRKSSTNSMSLQEFQTSWWHLLQDVEMQSPTSSHSGSTLQKISRLIHQHSKDVASNLILSIQCDEADFIDGRNPVQALLFTEKPHYLIATGLFFEYSRSSASIAAGERPSIVRLFLFHDFLLATYCKYVNSPLTYAFHMPLASLRCSDYRQDVGELAILLADSSTRQISRRKSMLDRLKSFGDDNSSHEVRRVLFAPTYNMKFDWLTLLMQSIASNSQASSACSGELSLPSVRGRISLDLHPLRPLWIEEFPKPSPGDGLRPPS